MQMEIAVLKEKVIKGLLTKKLRYQEAARELGVTPRTIHNYFHRFLEQGTEGLRDRRRGNYRKLTPAEATAIIACKQQRPQRSSRLIRNILGLKVSVEAVRLVLVKNHLNRKVFEARPN
ncbi:MAG TPA: helix-turn-helix domain-containing protein [Dehalococcoidia bacterium]